MSKPRIFISSTIYDFYDLRSALKYWLEELGYEVLLSEHNDFQKRLDANALEACLQTITTVDYYILLVGSRVGARYDTAQNISITMQEYRTAYEQMLAGKLKIIIFVRKELWDIRSDRQALQEFLEENHKTTRELTDTQIKEIVFHKSNFVTDAETIFNFISELAKEQETKLASQGVGSFPRGNWIHPFSSFKDVIEVIQVEFQFNQNLRRIALINNLKYELRSNLSHLFSKSNDRLHEVYILAVPARRDFHGSLKEKSLVSTRNVANICAFLLFCPYRRFRSMFIDQALISGEFLGFNKGNNTYVDSVISSGLLKLKDEIEWYDRMASREEIVKFITKYGDSRTYDQTIAISNQDLLLPFGLQDRLENIFKLSVALILALDGNIDALSKIQLNPLTPLPDEAEAIERERVTLSDVDNWLKQK